MFSDFWNSGPAAVSRILEHQRSAVESRYRKTQDMPACQTAMKHIAELEPKAKDLKLSDFVFALHAFPDNSVPHLHMHIIAASKEMRKYSTGDHDVKSILVSDVERVIRAKPSWKEKKHAKAL
jgi:diadenosine tetraphosphate (Ap4A) HIT family hydrolase